MKDRFISDREIAMSAVKSFSACYEHIGKELKSDREIAFIALSSNIENFQFLGKELRQDREFILPFIRQYPQILHSLQEQYNERADENLLLELFKGYSKNVLKRSVEHYNSTRVILLEILREW